MKEKQGETPPEIKKEVRAALGSDLNALDYGTTFEDYLML